MDYKYLILRALEQIEDEATLLRIYKFVVRLLRRA